MGANNSSRRRSSTTNSANTSAVSIPTLRFRKAVKGPNWQQDEELSWLLQIWRDDSFMFRVQTTVIVPQRFGGGNSTVQRETVLEVTYYGSSGRVVLTDANGVQTATAKIGSTFTQLFNALQGNIERKQAKVRGEHTLDGLKPTYLMFRTQRMEFKKRHQRPAHIADDLLSGGNSARGPRKSIILPDAHGLVQAIPIDEHGAPRHLAAPSNVRRESAPVLPTNYHNKPKPNKKPQHRMEEDDIMPDLGPIPDLDEAFDWEWECDGTMEEDPAPVHQLSQLFPQRVVDLIIGYAEPDELKIEPAIAPALRNGSISISRPFRPPLMGADADPNAPPVPSTLPPRAHTLFNPGFNPAAAASAAGRRVQHEADYHATPGCLRLFAEVPAQSDNIRISHHPILIKPPVVEDAKGEKRVDPDFDVTVNFLKEPTPEPVAKPTFEISHVEVFELAKWNT